MQKYCGGTQSLAEGMQKHCEGMKTYCEVMQKYVWEKHQHHDTFDGCVLG